MKSPSWPRVGTGSLCGTRTGLLGGICLSPSLPGSTSLPGVVGEGKARAFRGEPLLEWYVHRDHRIDPKPASTHTSLPPSPVHSEDLGSAEVKGGPVPLCPHHLQSQSRQGRGSSLQLLEMQNLTMMSTVSIPRGPASSRNPSNWLTDGAQNQTFENS